MVTLRFYCVILLVACSGTSSYPDASVPAVLCETVCPASRSDRCDGNACYCGARAPCDDPLECRYGSCYAADPTGEVCEFDHECADAFACIGGRCSAIVCEPEVCDGVDNDCNGEVDLIAKVCGVGPCAGISVCELGAWSACSNADHIAPEIGTNRCDGEDNDCDGETDEDAPGGVDVVFVLDVSASMVEERDAVRTAVESFASSVEGDVRFALVTVGQVNIGAPRVDLDFALVAELLEALAGLDAEHTSPNEPTRDAVFLLGTGALPLAWRDSASRNIVLFTDETAQSYLDPKVTEAAMCNALAHGESVTVFTRALYADEWQQCATVLVLSDAEAMTAELLEAISDPCE